MRSTLFLILIFFSGSLLAEPGPRPNAVLVLPFGGIQSLPIRDLNGANEVISLGFRRVVPVGEDVRISDIKVLADGSHLLADVSGRGFAITDKDGNYRNQFSEPNTVPSIKSVSVATYFSPGEPSILAIAESSAQIIVLRDSASGQVIWGESVRQGDGQGELVQIVVQPGNRVSLAANYASLGLSVIETFNVTSNAQEPIRFANIESSGQPTNTIIVPGMDDIRELMVLEDGSYLITTRVKVFLLSSEGLLLWTISSGDYPEVGGEFSSGRKLPSGLIAVSTYEPGAWTRPHFNHRLHWLDPMTRNLIATSDVFSAAPIRVEPLRGHGGTGTFDFNAGLNDIGRGDFAKIKLERMQLDPPEIEIGDRVEFLAQLVNEDTFSIALKEIQFFAAPGTCAENGERHVFGIANSVAISPMGTFLLNNDTLIDTTFEEGVWCAKVEIENGVGQKRILEKTFDFSIVKRKRETNSTVDIDDLPFRNGPVDFGMDVSDMGELNIDIVPADEGCCATAHSRRGPGFMFFFLFGIFLFRKRRP